MARLKTISANLNAFLDTLAYAEGTSTHSLTKDDGYDVIVTGLEGQEIFTDYSRHPFYGGRKSKVINTKGLTSNASGRYQHMLKDYVHYRDLLNLSDFGPESQDKWAIQLIRETGALPLIEAGKFEQAIAKVRHLWASLPGANYKDQSMRSMSAIKQVYINKGGSLWESNLSLPELLPQSPESLGHGSPVSELEKPKTNQNGLTTMLTALLTLIKKLLKRS